MSAAEPRKKARGTFGPVRTGDGTVRTDERFDLQNLDEEEREVVTADDFIIYGKANIEQWNDPEPGEEHLYIEMDALEEKIDQLLSLNNLSRMHKDIRVGEFLDSYEFGDESTVHLDAGDTMRFGPGDEIRTEVIREGEQLPGDNGVAEEDALWIAANVYGREDTEGSVISEETRLASYYGELDGLSVTVYTREFSPEGPGRRAKEVDFLAVTIGEDEQIKNKGSTYGVAEFQAMFGTDDAAGAEDTPTLPGADTITMGVFKHLFSQSKEGLVNETIRTAQEDEVDLQAAAEQTVGDEADAELIAEQAEERLDGISDRLEQESMDRDDLVNEVAEELGWDNDEVHVLFEQLEAATDEVSEPVDETDEEGDDEEEEEEEEEDVTVDVQALQEEHGFVTEEQLDERFDNLKEEMSDTVEESVESVSEDVAENLEEQLSTAVTNDPAGGGINNENDLKEEVEGVVDGMKLGGGS